MQSILKKTVVGLVSAVLALAANAQTPATFPAGPVTILSGFAAGGPTDVAARLAAKVLSDGFKDPVVVDTRAGANGLISIQALKRAKADGHTLLAVTAGMMTITPAVKANAGYDPIKDFTPIAIVGEFPFVLVARNGFPADDVAGLVDFAKKNPGKVNYGSAGIGSSNHLAGEWFNSMAKISMEHVPYKGDAPAIGDLLADRLDVYFLTPSLAMPQAAAGKLKVLGVASTAPTPLAAGVKDVVAKTVPGFHMGSWIGIVGPAGMPRDVVKKLNAAINERLKQPQYLQSLASIGQDPVAVTPEQFAARIQKELGVWTKVATDAKISVE
ncbi:Bug family tripartite tricarboxylate transporter substrate binding protein [Hydrogenophaga palleronii]|uniref:Bug family tripartite tricarboxylate transporter substrate binding protein n=1 Tax=Hydrogenophaga palleronii TaxID=65655 RepID=UPI000826C8C8|nr:tripartite tricarboxylate transporter substrate binding protein [Hydrogenophaga palleronii]